MTHLFDMVNQLFAVAVPVCTAWNNYCFGRIAVG